MVPHHAVNIVVHHVIFPQNNLQCTNPKKIFVYVCLYDSSLDLCDELKRYVYRLREVEGCIKEKIKPTSSRVKGKHTLHLLNQVAMTHPLSALVCNPDNSLVEASQASSVVVEAGGDVAASCEPPFPPALVVQNTNKHSLNNDLSGHDV